MKNMKVELQEAGNQIHIYIYMLIWFSLSSLSFFPGMPGGIHFTHFANVAHRLKTETAALPRSPATCNLKTAGHAAELTVGNSRAGEHMYPSACCNPSPVQAKRSFEIAIYLVGGIQSSLSFYPGPKLSCQKDI